MKTYLTELVALDFFTVPTVGFKVLFVLVVLAHVRRKVVHFNVASIRPPSGRRSNSSRPFPERWHRSTFAAIAMGNKPYPAAPTGIDLRQDREELLARYRRSLEQEAARELKTGKD